MAKKYNQINKDSIDDLLIAAHLIVNNVIPDSEKSHNIHYQIEVANRVDSDWSIAIPKSSKYKYLKQQIENVVRTSAPSAIQVILYSNPNKEHTRLIVKLDDVHIPAVDGDEASEMKLANRVIESDPFQGLGTIPNLMIDNTRIKYENELSNLRTQFSNEKSLLMLEHRNTVNDLQRRNDALFKENEELKEELVEANDIITTFEEAMTEKSSEFDDVKKSGATIALLGIASKMLGVDMSELSGLLGTNGQENQQHKQIEEKEVEFAIKPKNQVSDRDIEIEAINDYLRELDDMMFRKIISILQNLFQNPEHADTIIELLTEK